MKTSVLYIIENSIISKFIYGLIFLNIIALILESNKDVENHYFTWFKAIEYISIALFSLEYLLRLWTASINKNIKPKFGSKRLGYIVSGYGIIDLIAVLPFYLPILIGCDMRVLRTLRFFRILRILKLGRYSKSLKLIKKVLHETKPQLIVTVFATWILLIVASFLMYYAENLAQPDKFSSVADAMWWAIATLTTVGYGDVYPITAMGKILSAVIALIGIGFIALPTGILSSAFIENVKKEKFGKQNFCKCSNCGQKINLTEEASKISCQN